MATHAPTYPMAADAAIYDNGGTVTNAVISGNLSGGSGGSGTGGIHWLVTDHLGTPRMIVDQAGTLTSVKRHDYLPFGEELFAPTGGRSASLGYSLGDGVRQQFTAKERDNETGLDYFFARYYSSAQGRFTSADEPFVDQDEDDPQSWNLYTYVGNKPLTHTDPFGLWKEVECTSGKGQCWQAEKNDTITSLAKKLKVSAKQLNTFFQNPKNIQIGQEFDVSGFWGWQSQSGTFVGFVDLVTEDQIPGDRYSIELNLSLPIPGLGRVSKFIGQKASSAFGRVVFRGLVQNRPLRQLTHREIREAFEESGYKLSNHAIKRLKDPRTGALGIKTLNDVKQLLNNGTISNADAGKIAIEHGRLKAIVDVATQTIVSLVPR